MTVKLAPILNGWQGFSPGGLPLNAGYVYTYAAGSTTPQATYTTSAGNVANANPIVLGVDGRPPSEIWLTAGAAYRFELYDAFGNLIKTYDNLEGINDVDAADVPFLQQGAHAVTRDLQAKDREWWSVADDGAALNGSTNDSASFANQLTDSGATRKVALIPATNAYAKLLTKWSINSQSFCVEGQGIKSMLVASGTDPAIEVTGASHVRLSNFGISGIAGSSHGVHVKGAANNGELNHLLINFVGGDGVRIESGLSWTLTSVKIDNDAGYRPSGAPSDGVTQNGFYVMSSSGLTNNISMVNCAANSCANSTTNSNTWSCKIGDTGGVKSVGINIQGCLFTGSRWAKELYIHAQDVMVSGVYIEPRATPNWATGVPYNPGDRVRQTGTTYQCLIAHTSGVFANDLAALKWEVSTAYQLDVDGSRNVTMIGTTVMGDIHVYNTTLGLALRGVEFYGIDIAADTEQMLVENCIYAGDSIGPTGGRIIDRTNRAVMRNLLSAATNWAYGDNSGEASTQIFHCRFGTSEWLGGAAPTVPNGFASVGGVTLSRDAVNFLSSDASAQMVIAASASDGIRFTLDPVLHGLRGNWICVTVVGYAVGSGNSFQLECTYTSTGASDNPTSNLVNTWERLQVSFKVPSNETLLTFRLTGTTGATVRIDSIEVRAQNFQPLKYLSLTNSGTPSVLSGPCLVPLCKQANATNMTDLPDLPVGQPVCIIGAAAFNLVHDNAGAGLGPIRTKTGANIAMNGIGVTLMRRADNGLIYQVG